MKKTKILPLFIIGMVLVTIVSLNVSADTTSLSFGFRGTGSEQSPKGVSNNNTTITITPTDTTTNNGQTVGAVLISADPNTPYKNTKITFEWWTNDSLISVRKAYITMYEGKLGWEINSDIDRHPFPLSSRRYTTDNNHKNKLGHWTFKNDGVHTGIYSRFNVEVSNWSKS